MIKGKIVKGIGGFYYVRTEKGIIECRARGLFRKKNISPIVGDNVEISVTEEDKNTGYVKDILERKNQLIRPTVANIDQVLIVFAAKDPNPNLWLLDKFIILAEQQDIEATICFNKVDLAETEEVDRLTAIYEGAGYRVLNTSVESGLGIEALKQVLKNKTTALAGPSGVGKSTLLNTIQPDLKLETGSISDKTSRGKHTTRHVELMELEIGGYVFDTPGFSSLDLDFLDEDNLSEYFPEIHEKSEYCKFRGCRHNKEPKCAVKEAVKSGDISKERYENYIMFLNEVGERRKY